MISSHREIKLTGWQIFKLYCWSIYGNFCFCLKVDKKLKRLYHEGCDRIEKEFDIVKIVSSLRNMKVFLKNKLIEPKVLFEVKHSEKNVINIDHSFGSSSSEEDLSSE